MECGASVGGKVKPGRVKENVVGRDSEQKFSLLKTVNIHRVHNFHQLTFRISSSHEYIFLLLHGESLVLSD